MQLNNNIKEKLILQADEAREQGLIKLADRILNAIEYNDELPEKCSYSQLREEYYNHLWKLAKLHIAFYGLDSVDVVDLDKTLVSWASKTIDEMDSALKVTLTNKSNELKLPGEK